MNKIMDFYESKIRFFLEDMIGECKLEYRYGNTLWFSKKVGENNFVLGILITEEYNYVALTNIVVPPSMARKGVSTEIINLLISLHNETGLECFVTEITNPNWEKGLIKHGGILDESGDVFIDRNKWTRANKPKQLKFVEFEGELISVTELEQFKEIKAKCISEVKRVLESLGAQLTVDEKKVYIEEIHAHTDEEDYGVKFIYRAIYVMYDLINKNQLEEHLKNKKYIGYPFI